MKNLFCLALAACLGLPLAAAAAEPAAQVQDAHAPAAPIVYRSAFDGYQSAVEDEATPDQTWRAVNRKVGDAGGHMGHMKKMGQMEHMDHAGQHQMKMAPSAPVLPAPAAAAAPAAGTAPMPMPMHQHGGH